MTSAEGDAVAASGGRGGWSWYRDLPRPDRLRVAGCLFSVAVLALLFVRPLFDLARYAAGNDVHSHILLIPIVSVYLMYLRRGRPAVALGSSVAGTAIAVACGGAALLAAARWSDELSRGDALSLTAFAFVSLAGATGFLFLGARWMAAHAFPIGFLMFLVPLPDAAVTWMENASAAASAEVAAWHFRVWGVAVVRTDRVFELPGITLHVAQECSGIRSSWTLLLTSLLAAHLFLRTGSRRIWLVAFVIPLGFLRNGFRIFVIAWLCVNIGPEMIDSPIHHQGGPLFLTLSLIPFGLMLYWLRRQESAKK